MILHRFYLIISLVFIASCLPQSTGTLTIYPTITASISSNDQITPTIEQAPTLFQSTSGQLALTINSPADGTITSESQINIEGIPTTEIVLSVNEEFYVLPSEQIFSIPVTLEEGPNAIEIVASDAQGDIIELILTVIYQP